MVKPFSDVTADAGLQTRFRARPATANSLSDLVTHPPSSWTKNRTFFYHGLLVRLAPITFKLIARLAKRPGVVVTRNEIYAHLWPEFPNPGASANPYDRQISEHKRKITMEIKKALKGKEGADLTQPGDLIKTWRKVGYMLDLGREKPSVFE